MHHGDLPYKHTKADAEEPLAHSDGAPAKSAALLTKMLQDIARQTAPEFAAALQVVRMK
ncbi:MAG TPA: hypothetical protein VGP72_05215 [Planctomycetota bacterium]|jgi:hypothetical protein